MGVTLPTSAGVKQAASAKAKYKCIAVAFLSSVDKTRYGKLLEDLYNDCTKGAEHYPDSITKAYNLVVNYKYHHNLVGRLFDESEVVLFANVEK
jgi:hypothetical protein